MVGLAAGCGSDSLAPDDACNQVAAGLCSRFYACNSAAELSAAGLPATESECTTMFETSLRCSAQTTANACAAGAYHGDQASVCVDQVHGLDCATVRDPDFNHVTAAPACGKTCS
jgi:hypothetical protein